MRKLLVGIAVAALLSSGLAYADTSSRDGLINYEAGTQGSILWSFYGNDYSSKGKGACENFIDLDGGYSWSGIYDYDDYKWFCESGEEKNISITCDIEMYCTVTLDKTDVYFHIAQPTTYMQATITGSLMSNNGQFLGIVIPGQEEKEPDQPPVLKFQEDGFGRTLADMSAEAQAEHADIPLSLEFRYYDGTSWSSWDAGQWEWGNNHQDLAWWWGAVPMASSHAFEIKVDIQPMEHQGDGRYVVDPILVLAPVL